MVTQVKGNYILVSELKENSNITVGKLGTFLFPRGFYLYFGSAQNGLEQRVARHLRSNKTYHWHVDYLLQHSKVVKVWGAVTPNRLECYLASSTLTIPGFETGVRGFGSSDCRCTSHLIYTTNAGVLKGLPEKLEQLCGCKITPLKPIVIADDL